MLGIKAVFFDVDGTLFDRDLAQKMTIEGITRKLHHVFKMFETGRVVEAFIESDRISTAEFEAGNVDDLRYKRTKVFLHLLGIKEDYTNAITEMYIRDYPMINSPMAGAVPLVKELSTKFMVGVISNGRPDVQYKKLETIGLKDILSCIVISEEIGIRKPDPRIFQYAANIVQIQPTECLHIGDSYGKDVIGAKTAGMRACWYDRGSSAWEETGIQADFVITNLGELASHLGKVR